MHSDDELQTTLSKWPFILGDVLLVTTALAIAILGDWQLNDWQVAACVVSVALGAALFVLPYVVEFKVRVLEKTEDREANLHVLKSRFVNMQDQLEALSDRIEVIEGSLKDCSALQAQVADLSIRIREFSKPELASDSEPEKKAGKSREPRQRHNSEPRLLNRAIEQKRDYASVAVSRIIEAKDKKQAEPEKSPAAEAAAEEPPVKEPLAEESPAKEPPVKESPAEESSAEGSPAEESLIEKRTFEHEIRSNPQPELAAIEIATEASDGHSPVDDAEDMFAESVPSQLVKRARIRKSDTVVTASVFIGIGNKPFIRGSGGNLNWESGVAMEFEEIGKWRWVAPAELEASVEIQLYRNDEDPDNTGRYTLEPGQRLELSPVF